MIQLGKVVFTHAIASSDFLRCSRGRRDYVKVSNRQQAILELRRAGKEWVTNANASGGVRGCRTNFQLEDMFIARRVRSIRFWGGAVHLTNLLIGFNVLGALKWATGQLLE
ncbi:hypothetical protein K470DRAFT_127094 [Piedraia hortae CBS 480.64]|uniref:Uncharacterized protein n=1 Tax=Piedraia hortae CBS 480.64 TaxID=1314780 RepID=A0A6A7C8A8_9PEZI|nr:hypothetical protein K470DRAFT_127094 [Piedraia hortae CBS 480.64]